MEICSYRPKAEHYEIDNVYTKGFNITFILQTI